MTRGGRHRCFTGRDFRTTDSRNAAGQAPDRAELEAARRRGDRRHVVVYVHPQNHDQQRAQRHLRGPPHRGSQSRRIAWATMHALLNEPLSVGSGMQPKSILEFN